MGTNCSIKPVFEGQLVRFRSPDCREVWLFDRAVRNPKYGNLEWHAVNPDDSTYFTMFAIAEVINE